MPKSFRLISMVGVIGLLSGCFLEVIVPKGGSVTSLSNTNDCAQSSNCSIEIADTTFTDAFTAIPHQGYEFVKWMGGNDFLCDDATNTTCIVSNTALAGNSGVAPFIASDETFYIMPVFRRLPIDPLADDDGDTILNIDDLCPETPLGMPVDAFGCPNEPITDTVFTPDGREWAQLDLFNGLTHSDIAAACSGGVCSGTLNNYDVTGWIWASPQAVLNLLNSYESTGFLVTPVSGEHYYSSTLVPAMVANGFDFATILDTRVGLEVLQLGGYTSDPAGTSFALLADVSFFVSNAMFLQIGATPLGEGGDHEGAWLYRN